MACQCGCGSSEPTPDAQDTRERELEAQIADLEKRIKELEAAAA